MQQTKAQWPIDKASECALNMVLQEKKKKKIGQRGITKENTALFSMHVQEAK